MGLDSFFRSSNPEIPLEGVPEVDLCGGICSAGDALSFRGKVYSDLIEAVSGHDLYEEEEQGEWVREIADALEDTEFKDVDESAFARWDVTEQEYLDLRKVFAFARDNSLIYVGWW